MQNKLRATMERVPIIIHIEIHLHDKGVFKFCRYVYYFDNGGEQLWDWGGGQTS